MESIENKIKRLETLIQQQNKLLEEIKESEKKRKTEDIRFSISNSDPIKVT